MRRLQQGFTLIELILVILVLGVVSTSVTSFIRYGVSIYQDVSGRDKQISDSRFVIERLTRELRSALPNSVRVTGGGACVEFVPILASSSYVDIPVLPDAASNQIVLVESSETFDETDTRLVVYPLSPSDIYVNQGLVSGKVFDVTSYGTVDAHVMTVTLDDMVRFDDDSPTQRYFIIKDSVAYCQGSNNTIERFQGHALTATSPNSGVGVLMAERQENAVPFSLQSPTLVRNAIVTMDFTFTYADEKLRLVNEVNVANVP